MSNVDKQNQERAIQEKQLLLYQKNMAIAATNAAPLEKFFAQTYNKIVFLNTLEINNLQTQALLQLVTADSSLLSIDLYSPAIMSCYAHKHKDFNNLLIKTSLLKNVHDYTQEDISRQSTKVLKAITFVRNETMRQWLNASLAYTIMRPQQFEYIQAKGALTQLHNKYPTILPKP